MYIRWTREYTDTHIATRKFVSHFNHNNSISEVTKTPGRRPGKQISKERKRERENIERKHREKKKEENAVGGCEKNSCCDP